MDMKFVSVLFLVPLSFNLLQAVLFGFFLSDLFHLDILGL